ncbi:MAG: LacI family DNA-binding transcriptional regulator [Pseudomonadota bacterium]
MATIIDVAKEAGVSIKTVSRVMNNEANVRDTTRRRVHEAMASLDYTPSDAARSMRSGRSTAIGLLYSDPGSSYQSHLNRAMMQACSDAGRYLVVGLFDETRIDWRGQLEAFLRRTKVEDVILVPPMCDSSVLKECLEDHGLNYVLLSPSHTTQGVASVAMDDRRAAREMTQYLLDLGHRRIAHISGDPDHIASLLRRQGYEEAITDRGLPKPGPSLVVEGRFEFRRALAGAEKLLKSKRPPTAIFAASDDMAAAVYIAAGKLGVSIPEQLSVVGFDDVVIAQTIWPALTTVAQPLNEMAADCVSTLSRPIQSLGDAKMPSLIVAPHRIVIRESCAPPR